MIKVTVFVTYSSARSDPTNSSKSLLSDAPPRYRANMPKKHDRDARKFVVFDWFSDSGERRRDAVPYRMGVDALELPHGIIFSSMRIVSAATAEMARSAV